MLMNDFSLHVLGLKMIVSAVSSFISESNEIVLPQSAYIRLCVYLLAKKKLFDCSESNRCMVHAGWQSQY